MDKNTPQFSNRQRRATCAALYALGTAIPEEGIILQDLMAGLANHLSPEVFKGLVRELENMKLIKSVRAPAGTTALMRGPEYADGLEKLRLLGENLRQDAAP